MSYRIVCTIQKTPTHHNHIMGVGTGTDPSRADRQWTVTQVRAAIDQGTGFHTVSPSTGKTANVRKFDCDCGIKTIKSAPDAVLDNNLDNLRTCNFS